MKRSPVPRLALFVLLSGCSGGGPAPVGGSAPAAPAYRRAADAAPPLVDALDFAAERWIEQTAASLSLREEAGQLVIPWIPGAYASTSSPEFLEIADQVEGLGLGGVSISIGLPHSYA
ncbi:MAG: hypothetical protein KC645_19285, partial [Gemmatimonadetes bacterium]|nr:hypothetical protein [Gemmatimonadota bacterium]